ncbi:MAG: phosphate ABC transporter permease subunit PstC [Saprospiraceae bacterium]|nr:phosphate ABC transporter permease subunit PstC [Saprospiraceae bacterium]
MKISATRADKLATVVFQFSAWLSVVVLAGIFTLLLYNGFKAFDRIRPQEFFLGYTWNPSGYSAPHYGVLSLLGSTLLVTCGAMVIAIPLGIGTAAYLSESAPPRVYQILKPVIELFAGIPSVALGFIGITILSPVLAHVFGLSNGLIALNGAILLALMALPTIITVSEDAIRAVPKTFREASFAVGATRETTLWRVTLPAAMSGIITAVMLGFGRALGETMTVLMATGNALAFPGGFFEPVRTMTAAIAIELGETAQHTTHYYALFAVGALLFAISLLVNILSETIARRFRYSQS